MDVRLVEKLRAPIYRVSPDRRLRTMNAAARFVNQVGFCWLFAPASGPLELPSLFEALKGRRGVQIFDWDEDSDRLWSWKSDLPAARLAYYGKALAGKPAFVSLEMLGYLMAAIGSESPDHLYDRGEISLEARRIFAALRSRRDWIARTGMFGIIAPSTNCSEDSTFFRSGRRMRETIGRHRSLSWWTAGSLHRPSWPKKPILAKRDSFW